MKKILEMENKGQMTILGLIFIFLTITVFGALQPALNDVVDDAAANATGAVESNLINLIPLIILVTIVASIVMIGFGANPARQQF